MNRWIKVVGLGIGLVAAGAASAQYMPADHREYDEGGVEVVWAKVVSVDPIVENYDAPVERERCWNERVEYVEPRYARGGGYYRDPAAPTLIGALIGGAIGHAVGHDIGHSIGGTTAAGAFIGGSIGNSTARRPAYYQAGEQVRYGTERRCEVVTEYQQDDQVVGYDVAYEYNGRVYHTRTNAHPGDQIRVEVAVRPIE